jgi:hypothetical protein
MPTAHGVLLRSGAGVTLLATRRRPAGLTLRSDPGPEKVLRGWSKTHHRSVGARLSSPRASRLAHELEDQHRGSNAGPTLANPWSHAGGVAIRAATSPGVRKRLSLGRGLSDRPGRPSWSETRCAAPAGCGRRGWIGGCGLTPTTHAKSRPGSQGWFRLRAPVHPAQRQSGAPSNVRSFQFRAGEEARPFDSQDLVYRPIAHQEGAPDACSHSPVGRGAARCGRADRRLSLGDGRPQRRRCLGARSSRRTRART